MDVTISLHYFEELVRDSERLKTVKNFVKSNIFLNKSDLEAILEIESEEEE